MYKFLRLPITVYRLPRLIAVLVIALYQATLSPDHGPLKSLYPYGYCRHHPTCSEYAKRVILQRGVVLGGLLTLWRVLRCNPWKRPDDAALASAIAATNDHR